MNTDTRFPPEIDAFAEGAAFAFSIHLTCTPERIASYRSMFDDKIIRYLADLVRVRDAQVEAYSRQSTP